LEQGVIDGQENPLWVMQEYKFYEIQKYMTLTRHVYSSHIDVASLNWWQSLTPSMQTMIREAMCEAARFQRRDNREKNAARLAFLKEKGMQVEEAPELDAFRDKFETFLSNQIYSDPKVNDLLRRILNATR
jgi:TRAP-type C4-dicarboxylate transport system substrate-binding protein